MSFETASAKVISRLLDPIVEIPVLLVLTTTTAYLNGYHWRFLALLLFVDAILPGLYFLYLLHTKKITDWDISRRSQRLALFKFALASHLGGVIIGLLIDREPLAQILLSFWILGIVFTLITKYWKISLHAGVNSALATFAIYIFGLEFWWLMLLPIIVSWARIVYKKHTLSQVIAGIITPIIILPVLFFLLSVHSAGI